MYKANIQNLRNNTPKELKKFDNWVLRKNKVPFSVITGGGASSTKREDWTSFQNAVEMLELSHGEYDGLGFVFSADDDFLFIDLDDVGEEMKTWQDDKPEDNIVTYFMKNTDSYTEVSQSGEGLHIILKGKKPEGMTCKNKKIGLEIYEQGRYVALTGEIFDGRTELHSINTEQLSEIAKKYNLLNTTTATESITVNIDKAVDIKPLNLEFNEIKKQLMSIWKKRGHEEELNHLLTVGYHDTFNAGDESEQDMAILYDLAVITQGNGELMRDFFLNATALKRAKLFEPRGDTDYLGYSINNALKYYHDNRVNYQHNTEKRKKFYSWTSRGLMEMILDSGKMKPFKFVTFDNKKNNDWYKFINGVYVKTEENEERQIIKQFEDVRKKEPTPLREDMTEKEKNKIIKAHNSYKARLEEPQIRDNVEKLLKDEKDIIISSKKFDADDTLLNALNCVIKLNNDGVEFLPHDERSLFFKQMGAEYKPNNGEPTKWINFLRQAFKTDEEMTYIQRVVGYCLTASTKEQCMFILLGNGRDGKSVFLNVLLKLFGDYGKNAQATTFTGTGLQNNSHDDDFARLEGARLITINEANLKGSLNEQRVKQFTAGDYVTASEKYEKSKEFKPVGKIILATNYLPHVESQDEGIWRRIKVIPWDVPEVTEESKNLDLEEELLEELPLIFNWALEGYLDLISEHKKTGSRLREPERFVEIKERYRAEKDVVGQFLADRVTVKEEGFITIKDLYESFVSWSYAEHVKPYSKQYFNKTLEQKGFGKVRRSQGWGWVGLALNDNVNDKLDKILNFNR